MDNALIKAVLRSIPDQPIPDLAPAVMAKLPAAPVRKAGILDWLWSPRPVSLQWRPAYALAVMGAIAFAAVLAPMTQDRVTEQGQILVQFRLDAPDAQRVELAGNFTNWKPAHPMKRTTAGVWTIVVPLEPGVHNYSFVVDGKRWVADPTAPAVSDGFGGVNSQLAVLSPDPTRSL